AEHRVAEELQPLVGGRVVVLVGVGAVRQGALERGGHDRHAEGVPELSGVSSGVHTAAPGPAHDAQRVLLLALADDARPGAKSNPRIWPGTGAPPRQRPGK